MTRASRARATSERPRPSMQDLPFLMQDLPKCHHVEWPGVDRGRAPRMRLSSAPARSGARSSASCVFTASPRPRFRAGSGKMGCAAARPGTRHRAECAPHRQAVGRCRGRIPRSLNAAAVLQLLRLEMAPGSALPRSPNTRCSSSLIPRVLVVIAGPSECTADTSGGFARADGLGRELRVSLIVNAKIGAL